MSVVECFEVFLELERRFELDDSQVNWKRI
jgi:hypothetical protein